MVQSSFYSNCSPTIHLITANNNLVSVALSGTLLLWSIATTVTTETTPAQNTFCAPGRARIVAFSFSWTNLLVTQFIHEGSTYFSGMKSKSIKAYIHTQKMTPRISINWCNNENRRSLYFVPLILKQWKRSYAVEENKECEKNIR